MSVPLPAERGPQVPAAAPDLAPEGRNTPVAGERRLDDAVLLVACPECDAPPGQPCLRRRHADIAPHRQRIEAGCATADRTHDIAPLPTGRANHLFCQRCGAAITKQRPGHAVVDRRAAVLRAATLPRTRTPLVRWRLVHADCDGPPHSGEVRVRAEEFRTAGRLLQLSARLHGKRWVADTNFGALLTYVIRTSARHADAVRRHGGGYG